MVAKKQQSTALVNVDEEIAKEVAQIAKAVGAVTGRSISTDGKIFKLPNGQASKDPIDMVIVDFVNKNLYYTAAYNKNQRIPPACFAISKDLDGMAPSKNSPDAQSEECHGCPMNEYGTAPNGGGGKACRNTVLLALTAADGGTDEVLLLSISPTALSGWNKYVNRLKDEFGHIPIQVITRLSFDPNTTYPSVQFDVAGLNKNYAEHWRLRGVAKQALEREPDLSAPAEKPAAAVRRGPPSRPAARR